MSPRPGTNPCDYPGSELRQMVWSLRTSCANVMGTTHTHDALSAKLIIMIVGCRVALGRVTKGTSGLRRAPLGFQSTCNDANPASPQPSKGLIYAIYDNAQCYPEYRIFYDVR